MLSASAAYSAALPVTGSRSSAAPRRSSVLVECAHHVNKKATKKHIDRRPKKHAVWDRKRGGTKDYGPLPEAPPVWELDEEASTESSS